MALYLVTGGAGFIGSHIATALVARGDRVRILDDLSSGRAANLAHLQVCGVDRGRPVELLRGDVSDPEALARACKGIDGVFHEAAMVSVPRSLAEPERCYEVNTLATLRLLEAARHAGVERLVFAASSAAYGDGPELPKTEDLPTRPLSPYASSKVASEQLLRVWAAAFGMRTIALRYFNVFGPRQADDSPYTGVIALFARALLEGRRATIFGDGGQTRDFTFVEDVVDANLRAMDGALQTGLDPGAVFNVGCGSQLSVLELHRAMAEILGVRLEPLFAPARAGDVRHSLAATGRIRGRFGWEARTPWREGLAITLEWYRERHAARSAAPAADPGGSA